MPGLGSKADFLSPKMAKTRKQKELMVKDFSERLSKMKAAVFVNYRGISVPQIQELRKKLRKKEADFMIAQNRLLKIALKDTDYKCPEEIFKGPLAVSFGYGDEVAPSKIIKDFYKENQLPEVLGGFFEGKYVEKETIEELAKLPSHEELLAKFVYVINAPVSGFVNVLRGNMTGLINALNQIKESK